MVLNLTQVKLNLYGKDSLVPAPEWHIYNTVLQNAKKINYLEPVLGNNGCNANTEAEFL